VRDRREGAGGVAVARVDGRDRGEEGGDLVDRDAAGTAYARPGSPSFPVARSCQPKKSVIAAVSSEKAQRAVILPSDMW
jgi:hypothetical protein